MAEQQLVVANGANPPPPPPPDHLRPRNLNNGLRNLILNALAGRIDALEALRDLLRDLLRNPEMNQEGIWILLMFQILAAELMALRELVRLMLGDLSDRDVRIRNLERRLALMEREVYLMRLFFGTALVLSGIIIVHIALNGGEGEGFSRAAEIVFNLLRGRRI